MIVADLFNWTVSISGEEGTRYYAVDADDYSLCDTLAYPAAEGVRQRVAEWLFPFDLSFTSYDDQYVYPRLGRFSACALLLNVLLAVAYLIGAATSLASRMAACRRDSPAGALPVRPVDGDPPVTSNLPEPIRVSLPGIFICKRESRWGSLFAMIRAYAVYMACASLIV